MTNRLRSPVPEELDRPIDEAARRNHVSPHVWVRTAIERALAEESPAADALDRLARLEAPTADIDQMLAEIGIGRR